MITGSVQISKGYYYTVLNLYNEFGKRKPKWISTGLKVETNERKNQANKKQAEKIKDNEVLKANMESNGSNRISVSLKDSQYKDMLFCDYMLEWLYNQRNQVKPNTYIGYEQKIKGRLYNYFKPLKIKLIDLKARDIQDFINHLFNEGLKGNTICHYLTNINKALQEASIRDIILFNPMDKVPPVKKDEFIPEFYTDDELLEFIEVAKKSKLELPLVIAAVYGLRREEVLGITWNAIDFKHKAIVISKTVGRGKYLGVTQFLFKDIPKNKSSYRTLPLFDFIADLLLKYKEQYKNNKKLFGNTYCNEYQDYICLMADGQLMKPDYIDRNFSKIITDNNFKKIRLHDLRHSCATLLLRNGVPMEEIQKWLGHSSIRTTERYAHLNPNDKEIPAQMIFDKLNSAFDTKDENDIKKEQLSNGN